MLSQQFLRINNIHVHVSTQKFGTSELDIFPATVRLSVWHSHIQVIHLNELINIQLHRQTSLLILEEIWIITVNIKLRPRNAGFIPCSSLRGLYLTHRLRLDT